MDGLLRNHGTVLVKEVRKVGQVHELGPRLAVVQIRPLVHHVPIIRIHVMCDPIKDIVPALKGRVSNKDVMVNQIAELLQSLGRPIQKLGVHVIVVGKVPERVLLDLVQVLVHGHFHHLLPPDAAGGVVPENVKQLVVHQEGHGSIRGGVGQMPLVEEPNVQSQDGVPTTKGARDLAWTVPSAGSARSKNWVKKSDGTREAQNEPRYRNMKHSEQKQNKQKSDR
jgi:hypothetical protein